MTENEKRLVSEFLEFLEQHDDVMIGTGDAGRVFPLKPEEREKLLDGFAAFQVVKSELNRGDLTKTKGPFCTHCGGRHLGIDCPQRHGYGV